MKQTAHVLIVDDEPDIRELLEITMNRMGLTTDSAEDLASARRLLTRTNFQLCLTDMRLPDGDGLSLVEHIQKEYPNIPVAVISAHGTVETAIQALKLGAFDFLSKPVELKQLRALVTTALQLEHTMAAIKPIDNPRLIGTSPAFRLLLDKAYKLSRSQAPVFISGESGTGKELVARYIHAQGPRQAGPFVAVNCGAIPSELMESEFFGHKKGAFTGADSNKVGLFVSANGGTLFLDEIADLPFSMQVKLLRAIQEKRVRPIGDNQEVTVDVRILSATHKDLGAAVGNQTFREDLYYRINVIQLDVPPLRDRRDDIPEMAKQYLHRISTGHNTHPQLSDDAVAALKGYDFPGNVRELENLLERAYALSDSNRLTAADIDIGPHAHRNGSQTPAGTAPSPTAQTPQTAIEESTVIQPNLPSDVGLDEYLQGIERALIVKALESVRWNKTAAAKKLGISFRSLRYKMDKMGMD